MKTKVIKVFEVGDEIPGNAQYLYTYLNDREYSVGAYHFFLVDKKKRVKKQKNEI